MNKIYSVESPNNYQPLVPNNFQRLEQDGAGRGETLETRFNNNIMSKNFQSATILRVMKSYYCNVPIPKYYCQPESTNTINKTVITKQYLLRNLISNKFLRAKITL